MSFQIFIIFDTEKSITCFNSWQSTFTVNQTSKNNITNRHNNSSRLNYWYNTAQLWIHWQSYNLCTISCESSFTVLKVKYNINANVWKNEYSTDSFSSIDEWRFHANNSRLCIPEYYQPATPFFGESGGTNTQEHTYDKK